MTNISFQLKERKWNIEYFSIEIAFKLLARPPKVTQISGKIKRSIPSANEYMTVSQTSAD